MTDRASLIASYLAFRVRRRLSGAQDIFKQADRTWEIAPPETLSTPPSVVLDGEFDRIRVFERWTNRELELRRTHGGPFERPAVRAFSYTNAILYRGSIFVGAAERRILPYEKAPPPPNAFPVETIDEAALCGSYLGLMYFGHWLKDDAPLSLLAAEHGVPISPGAPEWSRGGFARDHVAEYVDFLGLPWRRAENALCRSLVMFDDEDFTTHKGARLEALRRRATASLGAPPTPDRRVFIKRGIVDSGVRRFANEAEIADRLQSEGFTVVDPSRMSVVDIAKALNGARLVVAAEGSHQVHSLLTLQEGGGLLAISAPERFCTVNKRWTDLLGLRYGYVVGDAADEGFTADFDRLRRTIDLFGA